MTEKMFFLCLSHNWIYLSHLTKGPDEKRSPGWVKAAAHVEAGPGVQSRLT